MSFQNDAITGIPAPPPTDYDRQYSFTDFQVLNPGQPLPGQQLDIEFNAVEKAVDETQARARLIQRDDGALANGSVGLDQLKTEARIGVNTPQDWMPFTQYQVNDSVIVEEGAWYVALASHVSSASFQDDVASGFWDELIDLTPYTVEAKNWATYPVDQLVPEGNLVDQYSAWHHRVYADQAQGLSEAARDDSQTAQGLSEAARDASQAAQGASEAARDASQAAQGAASDAAAAAEQAEANARALLTDFNKRYLGRASMPPTQDMNGDPVETGALYFRDTAPIGMYVFDGSVWRANDVTAFAQDLSQGQGALLVGGAVLYRLSPDGLGSIPAEDLISGQPGCVTTGPRRGRFTWTTGDVSTEVLGDPGRGVVVPPDSDPSGVSGGWVRDIKGYVDPDWFEGSEAFERFNAALLYAFNHKLQVIFTGSHDISEPIQIQATTKLVGVGGDLQYSPTLRSVGGATIFTGGPGSFSSESLHFEGFQLASATTGTGTGFYSEGDKYISQAKFIRVAFSSTLKTGINAPLVLNRFEYCDFGTYPGSYNDFTAIRSVGTVGTIEPNANLFISCVFRKSASARVIQIGTAGVQWAFLSCDFEKNQCTQEIIRNDGAGPIVFSGGYIESNQTPYFIRNYGNLGTALVSEVRIDDVHLNSPATSAVVKREVAFPLLSMNGCYGRLDCDVILNENGQANQKKDVVSFLGNYFVEGTGSYGELGTINDPGYTHGRLHPAEFKSDSVDADKINALEVTGKSVTSSGTPIARLYSALSDSAGNYSGVIHVLAMSGSNLRAGGNTNTAGYLLLVSQGGITAAGTVASEGVTTGAAANHPSFTWGLNGSNQLMASPIGATSGTFSFLVSSPSGIRLRAL